MNNKKKFIQLVTSYTFDKCCPEYYGKPYYSILYEENGKELLGYSSHSLNVISIFLKEYFDIEMEIQNERD